jgi:hypothetical protein
LDTGKIDPDPPGIFLAILLPHPFPPKGEPRGRV